jgi:glyoxylase-like metal-dependent hydrolase (beta-lactamase superfamily II)
MIENPVYPLSEHVYGMKAGPPDRPSLCAVVGARRTVMLDAGASDAHAREFLDGLARHGVRLPDLVVLTHWHWDHVFGAAEIGVPIIAHQMTAAQLAGMTHQAWDDTALDARVASGEEIAFCADNIKLELPEPRTVRIAKADIIFGDALNIDLGGVRCLIQHVGGDHAADACVIYVPEDKLLFLGDCLYDNIYAPTRHYTQAKALPLIDKLLGYDAQTYIEGHNPVPLERAGFIEITAKMRLAAELVNEYQGDAAAIFQSRPDEAADEDLAYYIGTFAAGHTQG